MRVYGPVTGNDPNANAKPHANDGGLVARTLWGWRCSDMTHFMPGTKAPVMSQSVGLCRPSSLGKEVSQRVGVAHGPRAPRPLTR